MLTRRALPFVMILFAATLLLAALARAASPEVPADIKGLERQATLLREQVLDLEKARAAQKERIDDLVREIDKIRAGGDPGFLEKRRLERLLAESREAGEQLETTVARIDALRTEYGRHLRRVHDAYTREMERAAEQLAVEKERGRLAELTSYFLLLRDRRQAYRPPGAAVPAGDMFVVEIAGDDTPAALRSKLDLMKRRLSRVDEIVKRIDTEIKALSRELDLSRQIQGLVSEYSLFDDAAVFAPGPRTHAARGDEGPSTPETGDESGVHISPIEDGSAGAGATEITSSIEQEIRRLKGLRSYMRELREALTKRIREIEGRLAAPAGRREDARGPIAAGPTPIREVRS
ncbi:hypothetical protein K8I61_03305 [bacterium]|nr:hypothetical protein [bacterium]